MKVININHYKERKYLQSLKDTPPTTTYDFNAVYIKYKKAQAVTKDQRKVNNEATKKLLKLTS